MNKYYFNHIHKFSPTKKSSKITTYISSSPDNANTSTFTVCLEFIEFGKCNNFYRNYWYQYNACDREIDFEYENKHKFSAQNTILFLRLLGV